MKKNQTIPLLINKPPESMPMKEIHLVVSQLKKWVILSSMTQALEYLNTLSNDM